MNVPHEINENNTYLDSAMMAYLLLLKLEFYYSKIIS
jgi:hypothetical protein